MEATLEKAVTVITERQEIFSREVLGIQDIMFLFDVSYTTAQNKIKSWKDKLLEPRCDLPGKIHVQDYIEILKLPADRYIPCKKLSPKKEQLISILNTLIKVVEESNL